MMNLYKMGNGYWPSNMEDLCIHHVQRRMIKHRKKRNDEILMIDNLMIDNDSNYINGIIWYYRLGYRLQSEVASYMDPIPYSVA